MHVKLTSHYLNKSFKLNKQQFTPHISKLTIKLIELSEGIG